MLEANNNVYDAKIKWAIARNVARYYRRSRDLDAFASYYYKEFPKHPPDPFDRILWSFPDKRRIYNRSGAKWKRANQAVGPSGIVTRLFEQLAIPTFITFDLTSLGFKEEDGSYTNYQDRTLISEVKDALREQLRGSSWISLEVSRSKSKIHGHAFCEHDAFDFDAYSELVYDPKGLFRYLIKGIPFNAENLAVYWKAKRALLGGKHLVRKTTTIRLPYSKN